MFRYWLLSDTSDSELLTPNFELYKQGQALPLHPTPDSELLTFLPCSHSFTYFCLPEFKCHGFAKSEN